MLIAFKIKLALVCAAGLAGPLAVAPLVIDNGAPDVRTSRSARPSSNSIPARFPYRVNGDFRRRQSRPLRLVPVNLPKPLAIMKHQVSSVDYQRCVDDGACRALDRGVVVATDRPAVQISWHDANGYAAWLSRKTGETYHLPTDEEWAFAAGSKFKDDGIVIDYNDPSKRWIARYEREADRAPSDPGTRNFGSWPTKSLGRGGNVWEWTASCFVRRVLDDAGKVITESPNCGVRVVEGQHRAYVTDFIRDAKAGGCAVGVPPDNLGFRLVVESDKWLGVQSLVSSVKAFI
jgi:formylglycine-generating enzyme required for sulfatase activity